MTVVEGMMLLVLNETSQPSGTWSFNTRRYEVMLLPVLARSMSNDVSSPTMASRVVPLWPSTPSTGGMLMVKVCEMEVGITLALL